MPFYSVICEYPESEVANGRKEGKHLYVEMLPDTVFL